MPTNEEIVGSVPEGVVLKGKKAFGVWIAERAREDENEKSDKEIYNLIDAWYYERLSSIENHKMWVERYHQAERLFQEKVKRIAELEQELAEAIYHTGRYKDLLDEHIKLEKENQRLREFIESKGICPNCLHEIAIRNPTGKCDHLYYPYYKEADKDDNE
jgi:hypothetical protein